MKNIFSPKTTLRLLEYGFIFIGIISIIVGIGMSVTTYQKTKTYIKTTGVITENIYHRGSSSRYSYHSPVLSFKTPDNTDHEFQAPFSSVRVMFPVGETVELYYNKDNPEIAFLGNELWYNLIPIAAGLLFFTTGYLFRFFRIKKKKLKEYLTREGIKITTTDFEAILSSNISVNNVSPWVIYATIQLPHDTKPYRCESEYIFFDPTKYLPEKVAIIIDPNDTKKYFMDLSFLPDEV